MSNSKEKWIIDLTHSDVSFKVKHLGITHVKGSFKEFDASIYTTNDHFKTAEIDCWINAGSITTNNADRDKHLISQDFFDVDNFPQISFLANSYEEVDGDGSFSLWGDLTIKGITKKVKFDVEFGGIVKDPWGNEKAGFSIHGNIHRKDFGLQWNTAIETGGFLLGDEVKLMAEIQLKRSA